MIQDLDGATSEPARRQHVVLLSASIAAVSLVLLVALSVPPARLSSGPQAASPAPSASAGPLMRFVNGPRVFVQSLQPSQLRVEAKLVSECTDGGRMDPPCYLVFEGDGQVIAAPFDVGTARSVPFAPVDGGSGWLTVPCDTSDVFTPRMNRAR